MKGKTKYSIHISTEKSIVPGTQFEVICKDGDYYSCLFPNNVEVCLHREDIIITDCTPVINWEERRFLIAKDLFANIDDIDAYSAVEAANDLIRELKNLEKEFEEL